MSHETFDALLSAALSIVVLCAGASVWLGKLLIRRHLAHQDELEARIKELEGWRNGKARFTRGAKSLYEHKEDSAELD